MTNFLRAIFCVLFFFLFSCTDSSQLADPDFKPNNTHISFSSDESPSVLVDEAHNNFLTIHDRYKPFAEVLLSDGFTVSASKKRLSSKQLQQADILVIANALDHERKDWAPPFEQALDLEEVDTITQWVHDGGSLLLIADHTPFPKMIENLALAFSFKFTNGHVKSYTFRKVDNTLTENQLTYRRSEAEKSTKPDIPNFMREFRTSASETEQIQQVKTFGGSAFKAPDEAEVLLKLGRGVISIEPEIPFQIIASTPKIPIEGWGQGAIMKFGKGRLAVFSEGMMFSSQLDAKTGEKYGLRSSGAEQNEQFLLNVMHWLAGTDNPI